MAGQGTLEFFDEFSASIGGRVNMDSDDFYIAFITLQVGGTPTISKTTPVPTWGAGGTTNLNDSEVTGTGGYTAEGELLANVTWAQTGGVATFNADDIVWVSNASGDPDDIKTAIIYSNDAAQKDCVGFIDMTPDGTTAVSLITGDITVAIDPTGIGTLTNP